MKNTETFKTLDESMLMATRGGGFAYDVGRVLRFIAFSRGTLGTSYAVNDWIVNEAINEAENGGG